VLCHTSMGPFVGFVGVLAHNNCKYSGISGNYPMPEIGVML
jgi:hypothetical protein